MGFVKLVFGLRFVQLSKWRFAFDLVSTTLRHVFLIGVWVDLRVGSRWTAASAATAVHFLRVFGLLFLVFLHWG